ncbi:MAG: toxin-antitoxin system protein [Candidatus Methylomirabilales bacterium]
MPSTRISEPTREVLRKLAEQSGESIQALLKKAVEMYRRQRFLEESNRAFDALRGNPETWKTEQAEREVWDTTLADGLEEE